MNYKELFSDIDGYRQYFFLDTIDHKSEILFSKEKLNVLYDDEYTTPDGRFIVVFCSVAECDAKRFMETIPMLISLLDEVDINYGEVCKTLKMIDIDW